MSVVAVEHDWRKRRALYLATKGTPEPMAVLASRPKLSPPPPKPRQGPIVSAVVPVPEPEPIELPQPDGEELCRREKVLTLAFFVRACFICGKHEWCPHREPRVEMAIAEYIGIGAKC